MGGQAAGELASALAIEAIVESVNSMLPNGRISSPGTSLPTRSHLHRSASSITVRNTRTAREWVVRFSPPTLRTIAPRVSRRRRAVLCLVGGTLERFTEDHSVVGHLLEMGMLTSEQARQHQDRGRLRQAVGLPRGIKPDLNSRRLNYGDRVLLCSDGLWDALPEDEIAAVFASQESMRQLSTVLVDRAIAAGADDNITAVLYEHKA